MSAIGTAQGVLVYGTIGNQLVAPPALYGVGAPSNSKPGILGQNYFDSSVSPRVGYVWTGAEWSTDASTGGSFTTLTVTGQSTLGATTIVGTTSINATGAGVTTIGNATSDTNIGGNLNLTSVAKKISMNGGAVTDFIGTATLVGGTVTIANTNIAATDRIIITRNALNASPALGSLIYTISAGVSFTVASFDATGVAVATDVSGFSYVIVGQT